MVWNRSVVEEVVEKGKTMIRAILTVKGGVGKTTTAMNLAAGFAYAGRKTLLIDFDGQANLSNILLGDQIPDKTITDVLSG